VLKIGRLDFDSWGCHYQGLSEIRLFR